MNKNELKRLKELEARVKPGPGQEVRVYYKRGEGYVNNEGQEFKREEIPGGEHILNILVEPAEPEVSGE